MEQVTPIWNYQDGEHERGKYHENSSLLHKWIVWCKPTHVSCGIKHLLGPDCVSLEYCDPQSPWERKLFSSTIKAVIPLSGEHWSLRRPYPWAHLHHLSNVFASYKHLLLYYKSDKHCKWNFLWGITGDLDCYKRGQVSRPNAGFEIQADRDSKTSSSICHHSLADEWCYCSDVRSRLPLDCRNYMYCNVYLFNNLGLLLYQDLPVTSPSQNSNSAVKYARKFV